MFCKITTTTDKKEVVNKISKHLLEKKYSPCIQITEPIESKYIWDGKIKSTKEYKLDIKTLETLSDEIIRLIKSIHNYKVPEIIKHSITIENKEYEEWAINNIKK